MSSEPRGRRSRISRTFPAVTDPAPFLIMAIKQEVALTAILKTPSRAFLAAAEPPRIARRWRFGSVAFHGSILAELIVFAALSQSPRDNLVSAGLVTQFSIANGSRQPGSEKSASAAHRRICGRQLGGGQIEGECHDRG